METDLLKKLCALEKSLNIYEEYVKKLEAERDYYKRNVDELKEYHMNELDTLTAENKALRKYISEIKGE